MAIGTRFLVGGDQGRAIKTLENDIATLRADLRDLHHLLRRRSKDRWAEMKTWFAEATKTAEGRVHEHLHSTYEGVRKRGREAIDVTGKHVSRRPMTSILTAFGIGAAISLLIRWRYRARTTR